MYEDDDCSREHMTRRGFTDPEWRRMTALLLERGVLQKRGSFANGKLQATCTLTEAERLLEQDL
jgi:hypothetical protein